MIRLGLKQLIGVGLFVLLSASFGWSSTYDYTVDGNYALFTNNSGNEAVVNLELWYGNGSTDSYYAYSTDKYVWDAISHGTDGQLWSSGIIGDGGNFWLKFVMGSGSDAGMGDSGEIETDTYYFEYHNGEYVVSTTDGSVSIEGCVAIMTGSSVPGVPLSAAVWFLGSGLAGMVGYRRYRK